MTLGQQAVQQAREETKAQATRETAMRMLDEGIDVRLISKITQLSIQAIKAMIARKHN